MFQSSSPSYLLLASLEIAMDEVMRGGAALWAEPLRAAVHVRHAWRASGGRLVCDHVAAASGSGAATNGTAPEMQPPRCMHDPLRITLLAADHGMSGYEFAEALDVLGMSVEMASDACVVLALGVGTRLQDAVCAADAFQHALPRSSMRDPHFSSEQHLLAHAAPRGAGCNGARPSPEATHPRAGSCESAAVRVAHAGAKVPGVGVEADGGSEGSSAPAAQLPQARLTVLRGVRAAAMGRMVRVTWQEAVQHGAACAGLVCAYPPGIPALIFGERVDSASVSTLQRLVAAGAHLTGCRGDLSDLPVVLDART
jgi:arginine decarboxylase